MLRSFTRGGGTLLTGPPGWKDPSAAGDRSRCEKAETGAAERYLARRAIHDRTAQPGRAAVQRLVDAVELGGSGRWQDRSWCTW